MELHTKINERLSLKERLQEQDRTTQKEFFYRYYALVKSIVMRYASISQEEEEVINDVFLKVFTKIDLYQPHYSMESWISRLTINRCIDQYRKRLKDLPLEPICDSEHHFVSDDLCYDEVKIIPEIKNLPDNYRIVFNLYVFEDFSHKEISDLLGISIGTSKSCLSRAKRIIKNYMEQNSIIPQNLING